MPIVPGSDGLVKDPEDAIKIAREVSHQPHRLLAFTSVEMTAQISLLSNMCDMSYWQSSHHAC